MTVAEVAIGIAGFSGVSAAFVQRDGLHPFDRNRFLNLFITSLSTLLLAFAPSFIAPITDTEIALWQSASAFMVISIFLNFGISYRLVAGVAREYIDKKDIRFARFILAVPGIANLLVQVLNATGPLWEPSFQGYLFGLLVYIYSAGFSFVYILLYRPRRSV